MQNSDEEKECSYECLDCNNKQRPFWEENNLSKETAVRCPCGAIMLKSNRLALSLPPQEIWVCAKCGNKIYVRTGRR